MNAQWYRARGRTMTNVQVHETGDPGALRALKDDWNAVHGVDSQATVFTSWEWLWGRLESLAGTWRVLVARVDDGAVAGILPLRLRADGADDGVGSAGILTMAGSPLADTTGFLCLPGLQDVVLGAFASHLADAMNWRRLELRDVLDDRLAGFLAHFPRTAFRVARLAPTPCPSVGLEAGWEEFLRRRIGSRRRQTLRRQLRRVEELDGLRTTSVADRGEPQIDTLLDLWQRRWGARSESELKPFREVFRHSLRTDLLWLDILWLGDEPMAGLLAFLDRGRSRFCFYISGYDERYSEWSPGTVVVAHSIREAIRMGFRTYDFLRGDEPYKYSFGARLEETANVDVVRS